MKPHNYNNEVELWLRSLAKDARSDALASPDLTPGESLSPHLDADELNTFAEGLVPEPARPRYLEHLADCSSCRRVVAGLTQSAGGLTSSHLKTTAANTTGFWYKVSAFLSPATLRYAVPALALAAMIGIGVLVMRQAPVSDFVARRVENSPAIEQTEIETAANADSAAPQASVDPQKNIASDKNDSYSKDRSDTTQPTTTDSATTSTLAKDAARPGELAGAASKPTFAPEPSPVAPAPPRTVPEDADRLAALKKEEESKREAQQQQEYKVSTRDETDANRPATATAAPTTGGTRRAQGLMNEGRDARNKSRADTATGSETRKVAGKSFRREGSVWVDTTYEPSRSTTNVSRDSERFGALVADEPGLRTVADQLAGEVIVVWKGRAYRIR